MTKYADLFPVPLADLYNKITELKIWPPKWKREFVTPIPKKAVPNSFDDLCNISCTALISKVYESYVMECMRTEVKVKSNQFGGMKGISVEHLLCLAWDKIGRNPEDKRAGTFFLRVHCAVGSNDIRR